MSAQEQPQHKRRIDLDVLHLLEANYEVNTDEGLDKIIVKFNGPQGTLYEKGVWKVRVEITSRYPFEPPNIRFCNKIFHPNIDEVSGKICLDVLNQRWSPMFELKNIFDTFLPQLLTYPNSKDPLNSDAGSIMENNYGRYVQLVKEYIEKCATEEALKQPVSSSVYSCRPDFQPGDEEIMDRNIREMVRQHSRGVEDPASPPLLFDSSERTPPGTPPPAHAHASPSGLPPPPPSAETGNEEPMDIPDDTNQNKQDQNTTGNVNVKAKTIDDQDEYSSESSMSDTNDFDDEEL